MLHGAAIFTYMFYMILLGAKNGKYSIHGAYG